MLELLGRFELPKVRSGAANLRLPDGICAFGAEAAVRIPRQIKRTVHPKWDKPFFGAAGQIRTADLVITNDALYRLSYSSMAVSNSFIIIAQRRGLSRGKSKFVLKNFRARILKFCLLLWRRCGKIAKSVKRTVLCHGRHCGAAAFPCGMNVLI